MELDPRIGRAGMGGRMSGDVEAVTRRDAMRICYRAYEHTENQACERNLWHVSCGEVDLKYFQICRGNGWEKCHMSGSTLMQHVAIVMRDDELSSPFLQAHNASGLPPRDRISVRHVCLTSANLLLLSA